MADIKLLDGINNYWGDIVRAWTYNSSMLGYIADLQDVEKCIIEKELNGVYDLRLSYSVNGAFYEYLQPGNIIRCLSPTARETRLIASPNSPYQNTKFQAFKIYKVDRQINKIEVFAHHICYELSWIQVVSSWPSYYSFEDFFGSYDTYTTATSKDFSLIRDTGGTIPSVNFVFNGFGSLKSYIGGRQGSFIDLSGCDFEFDNLNVMLFPHLGRDIGAIIDYGYNMSDFRQTIDNDENYLGVVAICEMVDGTRVYGTAYLTGSYSDIQNRYKIIDFSDKYSDSDTPPTQEELATLASQYLIANRPEIIDVSLDADYVVNPDSMYNASNTKTAKYNAYDNVHLGDTVTISNPVYGINNLKLRVIKVTYDVLKGRNVSVELNQPKMTLAKTISNLSIGQQQLERKTAQAGGQAALNSAASILLSGQ